MKTSKKPSGTSITTKKCQNGKKGVFKGDGQSDTMRSSKKPSGMSKTTKSGQKTLKTAKRMIFKEDGSLATLFSRLWESLKLFKTSHMSGYHMEPIGDNEVF